MSNSSTKQEPATAADVLTARDVAGYLQLPLRSVHEYAARGELPSVMIGRHRRFLRSQLDASLRSHVPNRR